MLKNKAVKNVLLIDDNETDNFIHKTILELNNFAEKTTVCIGGRAGLRYLSMHEAHPDNLPDIIFLDLNMPAVSGFQFLQDFENLPPAIKEKCRIIILTSSDNGRDKEGVKGNPFVIDYLTKPLSEEALETIRQSLSEYDEMRNSGDSRSAAL